MVVSPNSENVTEYTDVTFTCTGNVGRPAGTFQWFTFNENDVSSILDVTNQVTNQYNRMIVWDFVCEFVCVCVCVFVCVCVSECILCVGQWVFSDLEY